MDTPKKNGLTPTVLIFCRFTGFTKMQLTLYYITPILLLDGRSVLDGFFKMKYFSK